MISYDDILYGVFQRELERLWQLPVVVKARQLKLDTETICADVPELVVIPSEPLSVGQLAWMERYENGPNRIFLVNPGSLMEVFRTLVHEVCHCVLPLYVVHGPIFCQLQRRVFIEAFPSYAGLLEMSECLCPDWKTDNHNTLCPAQAFLDRCNKEKTMELINKVKAAHKGDE